jgi:hypothetical protein
MTDNGIRWRIMARIQRDTMSEKDRRHLDKALAALKGKPPERWPPKKVVRLGSESGRYMLILPRGIRAFHAPVENNGIEVHIVTHEESLRAL